MEQQGQELLKTTGKECIVGWRQQI
jgi:hypothetical protein